jgi:hypothetical protein
MFNQNKSASNNFKNDFLEKQFDQASAKGSSNLERFVGPARRRVHLNSFKLNFLNIHKQHLEYISFIWVFIKDNGNQNSGLHMVNQSDYN